MKRHMRKFSFIFILAFCFLLPLHPSGLSGSNDGSLQLDASRMENTNHAGDNHDDLYLKYNIELFNAVGNAKAEQNRQTQNASDSAMQQALFMAQSNAASNGIDLNQLFTTTQTSNKVETAAEPFDTAYLMYGIICIAIIGLLIIIIRAVIKEGQTNK